VVAAANPTAVVAAAEHGAIRHYAGLQALLQARASDVSRATPAASNHRGIETCVLTIEGELDEERFGDGSKLR
jgi:hypothetical protein